MSYASFRERQVARGVEATEMLAKYLESKTNWGTVSINEAKYSQGNFAYPDLVFLNYGVEVKRIEMWATIKAPAGDIEKRLALNDLKVNSISWRSLKNYCDNHNKIVKLVAVITWGKQEPLFIGLERNQVDTYLAECEKRPSAVCPPPNGEKARTYDGFFFGVNAFRVIREGLTLNRHEHFLNFFSELKLNGYTGEKMIQICRNTTGQKPS